jgi:hypothetical protein
MFYARRNTASYVELLNMNELNAKFPARKNRGAKSAHGQRWVYVFVIQFLVTIILILINLVISMNLWREAPCRRWR